MNSDEIRQYASIAVRAMEQARGIFLRSYGAEVSWSAKSERDPVSEVDLEIEAETRDFLAARSDADFLGEESGGDTPSSGLAWVLDPVDGTVNYLQGSPLCGISLALLQEGQPVLGVIDLPILGELYVGGQGLPATLNGATIHARSSDNLAECLVACGDYSVGEGSVARNAVKSRLTADLADRAYRVRMLGSAAIDLAWLSAGRHQASITLSNNAWDMAAGVAIAQASGALVVGSQGEVYTSESRATIASAAVSVVQNLVHAARTAGFTAASDHRLR